MQAVTVHKNYTVKREVLSSVLIIDVLPYSLGISTSGGGSTTIIERGTSLPSKKSEIFTICNDNSWSDIYITVVEEKDNAAKYVLRGIKPAPRGVPQIEITFSVDLDGILSIAAVEKISSFKNNLLAVIKMNGIIV